MQTKCSQSHPSHTPIKNMSFLRLAVTSNKYKQTCNMWTDLHSIPEGPHKMPLTETRQTDRKWCIRAHHAIGTDGLKNASRLVWEPENQLPVALFFRTCKTGISKMRYRNAILKNRPIVWSCLGCRTEKLTMQVSTLHLFKKKNKTSKTYYSSLQNIRETCHTWP